MPASKKNAERFPEDLATLAGLARSYVFAEGDIEQFLAIYRRIEALTGDNARWVTNFFDQYQRIRAARFGHEEAVASLDTVAAEITDPWRTIYVLNLASELLNLAGDEPASRERARAALDLVEEQLSAGNPLPGNQPKATYAQVAYLACLAGDVGAFNRYRVVSEALEAAELFETFSVTHSLMFATAECGDAEAGWAMLPEVNYPAGGGLSWMLLYDPIYAHYFSELPGYQARVAALER